MRVLATTLDKTRATSLHRTDSFFCVGWVHPGEKSSPICETSGELRELTGESSDGETKPSDFAPPYLGPRWRASPHGSQTPLRLPPWRGYKRDSDPARALACTRPEPGATSLHPCRLLGCIGWVHPGDSLHSEPRSEQANR